MGVVPPSAVNDTKRSGTAHVHMGTLTGGSLCVGDTVEATVDESARRATMGAEMIFDTSSGDDALLYSYYLEMVPHVYKVHGRDKKGRIGYKYSLSSKSKTLGPGEASETRISYKISPLTVIHEGQSSTISKFLVHLCAIVGGGFVVIGLLNKLLSGK